MMEMLHHIAAGWPAVAIGLVTAQVLHVLVSEGRSGNEYARSGSLVIATTLVMGAYLVGRYT